MEKKKRVGRIENEAKEDMAFWVFLFLFYCTDLVEILENLKWKNIK